MLVLFIWELRGIDYFLILKLLFVWDSDIIWWEYGDCDWFDLIFWYFLFYCWEWLIFFDGYCYSDWLLLLLGIFFVELVYNGSESGDYLLNLYIYRLEFL